MKNDGRSPRGARRSGWSRMWGRALRGPAGGHLPAAAAGLAVLLPAVLLLGGCEKIREALSEAVSEAAAKNDGAKDDDGKVTVPGAEVLDGLDRLRDGRRAQVGTVTGGAAEVRQIGAAEFDSFVGREDRLVVVDFYADWCGPCRHLGPVLERVCGELGPRVSLGKVNIDRQRDLAARFRVRSIPDVRVFRGGKQVDAFVGALPEAQLRSRLSGQFALLPAAAPAEQVAPVAPAEDPAGGNKGSIVPMEKDWLPPGMERR